MKPVSRRDAVVRGSRFDRCVEVGQLIGRAIVDRSGGADARRQQGSDAGCGKEAKHGIRSGLTLWSRPTKYNRVVATAKSG